MAGEDFPKKAHYQDEATRIYGTKSVIRIRFFYQK